MTAEMMEVLCGKKSSEGSGWGGKRNNEDRWDDMGESEKDGWGEGWGLPIHPLFSLPSSAEAFSTRSKVAINVLGTPTNILFLPSFF